MWDILKYTKFIGLGSGTPTELNQTWLGGRGYETGTVTGGVAVHDVKLDNVTVNQDPTESSADLYSATNMDYPDLTDENFTVDIKGVVNEKTYTMDDLRALPQTEITYTRVCMTNGSNGGWFIANIPTKGVLISDIIKDCGGLVEGANAFATVGYDGWQGFMTPQPNTAALAGMDPNAMIAIEQFGEPIDLMDGGPAYFILPGDGASAATKWIKEISFSAVNGIAPMNYTGMMQTSWAGWLNPATDGQTSSRRASPPQRLCLCAAGTGIRQDERRAHQRRLWRHLDEPWRAERAWTRISGCAGRPTGRPSCWHVLPHRARC